MKSYMRIHHAAMASYDNFESCHRDGDTTAASSALLDALRLERLAASKTPTNLQPTRSVLYRSAATIALEAGRAVDARHLITEGLRHNPPAEIQSELLELLTEESFVQDEIKAPELTLKKGSLAKRIVIRRAARGSDTLSMAAIANVQQAWAEFIDPMLNETLPQSQEKLPHFVPVQSAVGSFAVEYALSAILRAPQRRLDLHKKRPNRLRKKVRKKYILPIIRALEAERLRVEFYERFLKQTMLHKMDFSMWFQPRFGGMMPFDRAAIIRISGIW